MLKSGMAVIQGMIKATYVHILDLNAVFWKNKIDKKATYLLDSYYSFQP